MHGRPWTEVHDDLVRTLPPQEAARTTGRTVGAIYQRRWQLGMEALKRPWSEAEDRLLARLPPDQAARYLRRTADAIARRLRTLGLIGE